MNLNGEEKWVDADAVAKHLGFTPDHIRKMAITQQIPGYAFKNGARVFWRFRIGEVDRYLSTGILNAMVRPVPKSIGKE